MYKTVLVILIVYGALCLTFLVFTNTVMFPAPYPSYEDNEEVIKLELPSGDRISAVYLPAEGGEYTILYSHGNGEDIGYIYSHLVEFRERGYSVFAYDYPGYGTSEGRPNEESLYESIFAAYRYLREERKVPASKIVLYGVSIGSGPTVELASKEEVGGVILQSPLLSAYRVLTRVKLFPWDRFENISKIKKVKAPLYIMHGKKDRIISFYHGKRLYEEANDPKMNFWVEKGDHNRLIGIAGEDYWTGIRSFINMLK